VTGNTTLNPIDSCETLGKGLYGMVRYDSEYVGVLGW